MNKSKRVKALISAAILICALIFVAYELFQVREIKITGCASLSEAQVETLSGLRRGQCIFLVNTDAVNEALEQNPYVKPLRVSIEYPYTVVIGIEERTPAAYIDKGDIRLTIDREGVLLEVDASPAGDAKPTVSGLSTDRMEVGQPLGEDAYKRKVFSDLLSASQNAGIDIQCYNLDYTAAIKLVTGDRFTVELGDENALDAKLNLAQHAIAEMKEQGKTGGIIDVATGEIAYYREN